MQKITIFGSGRADLRHVPPGEALQFVVIFGSQRIDLADLPTAQEEVRLNIIVIGGSATVIAPPGVAVLDVATELLGSVSLPDDRAAEPSSPLLRLGGLCLLGSISIKTA